MTFLKYAHVATLSTKLTEKSKFLITVCGGKNQHHEHLRRPLNMAEVEAGGQAARFHRKRQKAKKSCQLRSPGQPLKRLQPRPNDLVYVQYRDHVLFKNANHSELGPVLRETVGFLTKQTNDAIWLLWDRCVKNSPDEQANPETGLIILRSDIKEIRKI